MSWYDGTYCCGHSGRIDIVGPRKDRERTAEYRFSGLCPECWISESRNKAIEVAKSKTEEMELPTLTGTTKQVEWATILRVEAVEKFGRLPLEQQCIGERPAIIDFALRRYTTATYWIDNYKNTETYAHYTTLRKEYHASGGDIKLSEELDRLPVLYPENQQHVIPVRVVAENHCIMVYSHKNQVLMGIVKSLGYYWGDGRWEYVVWSCDNSADRAAELCNKLLAAGFAVEITDEEIGRMAIDADFKPERRKKISLYIEGDYAGLIRIKWYGYNDDLYIKARSLPGAKWIDKSITVSPKAYKEIRDFAELFDFDISAKAKEAMDKEEEVALNAERIKPSNPKM